MSLSAKLKRRSTTLKVSKLIAFDLDRTIVSDNCSFNFCRYLVREKVLPLSSLFYSFFYYVRHLFLRTSLVDLHTRVFERLLRGRPLEMLEAKALPFLQNYLHAKFYHPVIAKLRLAQHLGHYTLILSSSPSFLVEKVARLLGVDEWRATEYAVDNEKNLCHIAQVMQGDDKAACVKEIADKLSIGKEHITAYSDSFLDLPFLLTAGTPVAVNPDAKLRRFSLQHEWSIL
jgi:HAD superfamily hydrolase (TIGR01490 family)